MVSLTQCFEPSRVSPPTSPRRVLIVSPHFPPINAPDHQRIRVMLPNLPASGWAATILTVQPDTVEHPIDELLQEALPTQLEVVTTQALPVKITRKVGLGNLGLRSLPFLANAGNKLLSHQKFDLIFFSTTIFPVMALGPYWQNRFGIPYVLDFQDPWRVDTAQQKSRAQIRPGGRLKYALDKTLAQYLEPRACKSVSHILSVSPSYPQVLRQRYPWLQPSQFTVLPFGAPDHDFEKLPQLAVTQPIFQTDDNKQHWVYVGRGGDDMTTALRLLFKGIRQHRQTQPDIWNTIRLHFVGTSYATTTQKPIEALAQQYDIADIVSEHPQRIPYYAAQQLLIDSDAILLIGSDDPSYSASKLYPAILAKRPILALFHEQSLVVDILARCQAGQVITFNPQQPTKDTDHTNILARLTQLIARPPVNTNWQAFAPFTGKAMTQKICHIFNQVVMNSEYSPRRAKPYEIRNSEAP